MNCFFVYILKCNDGSYYTGHTDDLERRISEHKIGLYCKYTSKRRPIKLVFYQTFETRDSAFVVERKIKNWSRRKKEALIEKNWTKLSNFSKKKFK
ncbi:GIY-YIG nuclease family protein [Candidatus Dependentiae bacterium]|nr:GIY-YIG nuclease family protein [Candidatus Dependentiae bacterium]